MTKLFGIDISEWQPSKSINYDLLSKKLDFVILRVGYTGYGTGKNKRKDAEFERHYSEFVKRGVPVGVYWYSCASTVAEAKEEARLTLEWIKGKKIEYPVYFDTEDNYHQRPLSREDLTDVTKAYCEAIQNAGYFTGIYASLSWLNNELNMKRLPFSVWVAQWGVNAPSYDAGMWQYTSDGSLEGYNGRLDCNYSFEDFKKIITEAGLNNLGKAPVEPEKPVEPSNPSGDPFKYHKGDKVIFSGPVFSNSSGAGQGASFTNKEAKVDFNAYEATDGSIKSASKPYHVGGIGWVAEDQIGKKETTPSKPSAGASVALNNTPLYANSTTSTVANKLTGTYYYWDNEVINGRRRITNAKNRVGVKGQVTGFIKA